MKKDSACDPILTESMVEQPISVAIPAVNFMEKLNRAGEIVNLTSREFSLN